MKRAAIVDNTVLANLMDAGLDELLDKCRIIFENFYIPETILGEFLNVPEPYLAVRQRFADRIFYDRGFFRRCNTFDSIVLGTLQTEPYVDLGEAEAIAQAVKRDVHLLLTDDIGCRDYIHQNRPYLQCRGTPFLMALLDLNKFLLEPEDAWKNLYKGHRFNASDLRDAYINAYRYIGIAPDRKVLKQKSSLKRILEK